jgi:hypothetical protein
MGNLNSLESYTAVVKLNIGNSAMRHPYSYQVVQVDGFITVCLNLQMVSNSRCLGPTSTKDLVLGLFHVARRLVPPIASLLGIHPDLPTAQQEQHYSMHPVFL